MQQLQTFLFHKQRLLLQCSSLQTSLRISPRLAIVFKAQGVVRKPQYKLMGIAQLHECQPSDLSEGSDSLWQILQKTYERAEMQGAIVKIHSKPSELVDKVSGLMFVLQIAEAFKDKPKSKKPKSKEPPSDVFESLDQDLTVLEHLPPLHMLRLNKFNVVPYHSLVITRQFESQQAPLTLADWEATFGIMQAYPDGAIAYFNSGEDAGASQPRKHLQILPIALNGHSTAPLPFEKVADDAFQEAGDKDIQAMPLKRLQFQSFAARLPPQ